MPNVIKATEEIATVLAETAAGKAAVTAGEKLLADTVSNGAIAAIRKAMPDSVESAIIIFKKKGFDFVHDAPAPGLSRQVNALLPADVANHVGGDLFGFLKRRPDQTAILDSVTAHLDDSIIDAVMTQDLKASQTLRELNLSLRKDIMGQSDSALLDDKIGLLKNYIRTDSFAAARDVFRPMHASTIERVASLPPDINDTEYLGMLKDALAPRSGLFHLRDSFRIDTRKDTLELWHKVKPLFHPAYASAQSGGNLERAQTIARNYTSILKAASSGADRTWKNVEEFSIAGKTIRLGNDKPQGHRTSWFHSEKMGAGFAGSAKLHVLSSDTMDEDRVRTTVLPFLADQVEDGGVHQFKTLLTIDRTGQRSKIFTIFPAPERTTQVAQDLDQLLVDNKLIRHSKYSSGTMDENFIVRGALGSRRVGLVRDLWPGVMHPHEYPGGAGAILETELTDAIEARYPGITGPNPAPHLMQLEKDLNLKSGELIVDSYSLLRWKIPDDDLYDTYAGTLAYVSEVSGAIGNSSYPGYGRPALYGLYKAMGGDPIKSWSQLSGQRMPLQLRPAFNF